MMKFISMIIFLTLTPKLNFNLIKLSALSFIILSNLLKREESNTFPQFNMIWDSFSLAMMMLTLWVSILMLLILLNMNQKKSSLGLILSLLLILTLAFSVSKLIHFYILFEASLIPTFILIMGWGFQPERLQASIYLLLYTTFFSLPLLLSIMNYQNISDSDSLPLLQSSMPSSLVSSMWMMLFSLAFLMKMPVYFLHLWLPKAHVEAPVEGSMVLAGVLLKLGGYGLVRVCPLIKHPLTKANWLFLTWALVGGLFAGIMCFSQLDVKLLIALSSVAHMALVIAGTLTLNKWGLKGSILLMMAHGFSSSGLFFMNNLIYNSLHSRSLLLFKGMKTVLPIFTLSWFTILAANMAAPPSLNLISEIMLIISIQSVSSIFLLIFFTSIFLSAIYSLYLYSASSHGKNSSQTYGISPLYLSDILISVLHIIPIFFSFMIMKVFIF